MVSDRKNIRRGPLRGMRGFYVLWFGQFISIFASRMTAFVITLWAWDLTGSATSLVLVGVAFYIPRVILSPFAGTLVDRWNRKLIMMLSDFASALATLVLLLLFISDRIQIWHLYVTGAFAGIFDSFQYPAYSAVVTTMVPKEQYTRANSLRTVIQSASGVGAPLLAGTLVAVIKLQGIMLIDLVTFLIALGALLITYIPQPEVSDESKEGRGSIWEETLHGLKYVWNRSSLLAVFLLFAVSNIATSFGFPMISPMIMAKTGNDPGILGTVRSVGSLGFMAGGLLMSIWKGPKNKMAGINISFILWGVLGAFLFGSKWSMPAWIAGSFFMGVFNPLINTLYLAILQSKVAADLQGRIFGLEYTISIITYPIGQVIAGITVDNVFEPAMSAGGSLERLFGGLVGVGPGAGIGLMVMIAGIVSILVGVSGFAIKSIREIETLMPDHETIEEPVS